MLEGKTIGVVIPCYNEARQIGQVLATMPDFVDCVIVVDDVSGDGTVLAVEEFRARRDPAGRIVLIRREVNGGVGAAIATGYAEAVRRRIDVTAVMAGDGQMPPDELASIVGPVARGEADYAKGNRLFHRAAWEEIPRIRYLGNATLSMLTKIASGYWHVADSQSGYAAIGLEALEAVHLEALYPRYGFPNDMLVRLNVCSARVMDVPIRPVYRVGEASKMRIWKVIPTMSWMILKRFCWRMREKYVNRDFHPLVLFDLAAAVLGVAGVLLFCRLAWHWAFYGRIPAMNALAWVFCMVSSSQFSLFAMWFDMETNRDLKVAAPARAPARCRPAGGSPEAPGGDT